MIKIFKKGLIAVLAMSLLFCAFLPVKAQETEEAKKNAVNPYEDQMTSVWVTASGLNIRPTASTRFDPIDVVPYGTELQKIKDDPHTENWIWIWYDGRIRFVCSDYVSDTEPAPIVYTYTPSYSNYNYCDSVGYYDYDDSSSEESSNEEVAVSTGEPAATGDATYSPSEFRRDGVEYANGYRWTWYSERVLPGGGLDIPGRYTDDQGYVRDGDGYVCLASDDLEQGTVVETPFGSEGKVYDSGCDSGTLDVYVGW